ncbi:MAG: hypothetical protein ABSE35_24690 [Bryobacteraceae bacterium]|jgi:hypothetical protein
MGNAGARSTRTSRDIKRLYDFRFKVIHGGVANDEAIVTHIIQVRAILSRLLCRVVEHGLWTEDTIEATLFG